MVGLSDPKIQEKQQLRERFRAARLSLSDAEYADHSRRIQSKIFGFPEVVSADTVHIYWPLLKRKEVDTRELVRQLHDAGKRTILPIVEFENSDTEPTLRHGFFEGEDSLTLNKWGVFEPRPTNSIDLEKIDVVVVPAFGGGRNGHRIGHGAGFYDAFLASLSAIKICPAYACCVVDCIPAEPHDVPLDIVVTELDTIRINSAG